MTTKDGVVVNLLQIFEMFPNAEAARVYLEDQRWGGQPVCPHCSGFEKITARKGKRLGYYRCRECNGPEFTVRTASIFERSHVPLHKWIYAIYTLLTARKGISSTQLSKELSVTQATAWLILSRLREACGSDFGQLRGILGNDETFVSEKESSRHTDKKFNSDHGLAADRQTVLGVLKHNGRSIATVQLGNTFHKNELTNYAGIKRGRRMYTGATDIRVVSTESMRAVRKRGLYGTWNNVSVEHLHGHINEPTFRYYEGNASVHAINRIKAFRRGAHQLQAAHQG